MSSFDSTRLDEYYARQMARSDDPSFSLYSTPTSQRTRWDVVFRHVPLEGKSLLDVGAGVGEFLEEVRKRGIQLNGYVATEPVAVVADGFAKRHPGAFMIRGDLLGVPDELVMDLNGNRRFDAIVGTSITCVKLGTTEASDAYWHRMIEKMFGLLADGGVLAMNWFSIHKMNVEAEDYVVDPAELFRFCRRITERVLLDASYMPHDFTTVLYAGESDWKKAWRSDGATWTKDADRLRGR
jgi:hypothetical protein